MTKSMTVQVRICKLRNQPSFLGKIVADLAYGDRVFVEDEKNSWVKVQPPKKNNCGWVHISALTEKEIILNPESKNIQSSASTDELALAGKGFNKQVEEKFKQKNGKVDFTWVDKMEKIIISQNEIQEIIRGIVSRQG